MEVLTAILALTGGLALVVAGLVVETGRAPSSTGGWVALVAYAAGLVVFYPAVLYVVQYIGESGTKRLDALADWLELGRVGRMALLVFAGVIMLVLMMWYRLVAEDGAI